MDLPTVWFVAIAVLWTGYFVLEGFDFGVGMLLPVLGRRSDADRRVLINAIGPVWDGNEVWLITALGAMFAAFPAWYAGLLSGFYVPVLLVVVALIGRGVAFEYRGKVDDARWRARWDAAIVFGSAVPAFTWGLVFANVVRGVELGPDGVVRSSLVDLLNPYALLGGLATVGLFVLHGAVFLALKTDGPVRRRARAAAAAARP
ncbi:cytochrome d ubiquinol oxidase subunit II, partial [Pseudonocardia sp. CNS-004]